MIKIYGLKERLNPIKAALSDAINDCMVQALEFPADKRAHRFFPMEPEDYYMPAGRSDAYTVIEIAMMSGRSESARKRLIKLLFETLRERLSIAEVDVEIIISESPPCNFGFRGMTGDEAKLNYRIDV
ncbi:MAG TPA: tautomerase family protein [Polyangiaceae bacterium]|jgi:5-carboxymethyl-2-hydroxymuconate isomerase|nr:tautomerase family protein [Polyangiaceae bacterium]